MAAIAKLDELPMLMKVSEKLSAGCSDILWERPAPSGNSTVVVLFYK
jgi:hypothetical protein